mmetsp:Transcript_32493/g.90979  ORF Transcript_32493/g.90979 Transcript_32493/m.90979 type:complete len:285 (+) Transcript_32493:68-922(+)|eukprot:CAMPEP_0119133214 /NCGR_PEP_ID=MMETSP1310-20130426/13259_1 /TAXON_ID=464262 /ORGANISM="Genus nov. species nov., Strain RCC2339" /LENGTH=284 /DNA_ID=CAMNT_0007123901 /DNA_START=66 /DNA_END=920 /DNA_ORIENTATION=-
MGIEVLTDKAEASSRIQELLSGGAKRPTFVYLDCIGLGWPIRAALALSGEEYDDIRISLTAWLGVGPADLAAGKAVPPDAAKLATPNCHLPLFCDGDVCIQQSTVILRYLGKKYGLWCKTDSDELHAEQVLAHVYDSLFHYTGIFQHNQLFVYGPKPSEYHAKQVAAFNRKPDGSFYKNMMVLQRYLESNPAKSGYMAGPSLTVVDLAAASVATFWYKAWNPQSFSESFPLLEEYIQRIGAIPEIVDVNRKRCPHTWLHGEWAFGGYCERFHQSDGHKDLLTSL